MHSQTLQALRAEIEAVTTLQHAMNRIAQSIDPDAVSLWEGPRAEDVDEVAADDGSFLREAVTELRAKAGAALAERYREVERTITGRAALEALLRNTLHVGSGGVISQEGPPPGDVLSALTRSGALRVDWASSAATLVRDTLEAALPTPRPTVPATPKAKGLPVDAKPVKKKVAKATPPVKKKKAATPAQAKKPAAKKKKPAIAKKKVAKQTAKKNKKK